MTAKRTWQILEQRVCDKFGGRRTPLSGSNSQHGTSADCIETEFPWLYIEIKLRASFLHHSIFNKAAKKAKAEDKTPILITHVKNAESELVILRIEDFLEIVHSRSMKMNSGIASQSDRETLKENGKKRNNKNNSR